MSSKRDPKVWVSDILDSIQEIEDTIENVEAEAFTQNHILINAVSYALLKITEATKHLIQSNIELPSDEPDRSKECSQHTQFFKNKKLDCN